MFTLWNWEINGCHFHDVNKWRKRFKIATYQFVPNFLSYVSGAIYYSNLFTVRKIITKIRRVNLLLTETFSSKITFVLSFVRKPNQFFQKYEPNCVENVSSRNVEEFFLKIPGSGSRRGRPKKFNDFFLVHGYICGKIYIKIRLYTDKHRQTSGIA